MREDFTTSEIDHLISRPGLGRVATIGADGSPHVVPVGWLYNAELATIDISGRDADEFIATRKYRNAAANPLVGFVVDDVLAPWQPRCVSVSGHAVVIDERSGDGQRAALIRITAHHIRSWGLDPSDRLGRP